MNEVELGGILFSYVRLSQKSLSRYKILSHIYSKKLHNTKTIHGMFFDRNISMFTLLGNNLALRGSTMYPPELNTHSDGTLVPQIQ